jgi:tripartite-type tricarboxylate transporter receptor subunit TctC
VLVVPPDRNWKTVRELIAAAKAKPGSLNFSSVGVGSATHLSAERFRASAGVDAVHVPFKGGAEAMTEVIAGRIDFFFGPIPLVLSQIQEGKLTALAVNGTKRAANLPDVPTLHESGVGNAEYPIWLGMFVPAKTPREIVDRLNRETLKALAEPKIRDKLATLGFERMEMTPGEFAAHIDKEVAMNAALVKEAGIKVH